MPCAPALMQFSANSSKTRLLPGLELRIRAILLMLTLRAIMVYRFCVAAAFSVSPVCSGFSDAVAGVEDKI